jgi:ribosomal protein S18 acetylase RimI-like enzyme
MTAAELHARRTSNHLYLLVTTDNLRARAFYERHGYRHVGDLPGLVWPDLDEALYHKALRGFEERVSG